MTIPVPGPHTLLPPLFACLPTAFVSPRPPPALLPLLSPILRQRLQYSSTGSSTDGWLSLLCWDSRRACKLREKIEQLELEPHPVSGELEIEHTGNTSYKRLDEETLQVRFELDQYELLPIYVWCESDEHAGSGPGWRLSELQPLEPGQLEGGWHASISEAEAGALTKPIVNGTSTVPAKADDEDDGDYWASYDCTPGRTPSVPPPNAPASQQGLTHNRTQQVECTSDDDYYARYGSVQPAMDNHDPDEAPAQADPQTLPAREHHPIPTQHSLSSADDRPIQRSLFPADIPKPHADSAIASQSLTQAPSNDLSPTTIAPRPISPASSTSSKSVERLEKKAQVEADMTRAETGVKHFIGSEVRSLFRLARSIGMESADFREAVERELDLLSMLEDA